MRIRYNATAFEEQDRVRLIECNGIRLHEGELGTVEHVGSRDAEMVTVRWDADGGNGTYWPEQLLYDLSRSSCIWNDATRPAPCARCTRPVEESRECYATPICYACLPPPEPLSTKP